MARRWFPYIYLHEPRENIKSGENFSMEMKEKISILSEVPSRMVRSALMKVVHVERGNNKRSSFTSSSFITFLPTHSLDHGSFPLQITAPKKKRFCFYCCARHHNWFFNYKKTWNVFHSEEAQKIKCERFEGGNMGNVVVELSINNNGTFDGWC